MQQTARKNQRLSSAQIHQLDELGFVWNVREFKWRQAFAHLERYKFEHGETLVPHAYTTCDGSGWGHGSTICAILGARIA